MSLGGTPRQGEDHGPVRPNLLLTSFLVGILKHAGRLFAPKNAPAFLSRAGRAREEFLPFFYRWFDDRPWATDQALRFMRIAMDHEGVAPPRVFHAPFTGRYWGPLARGYRRDLADPHRVEEHARALIRECAFFGRMRTEFGIVDPVLYIIHLGRRGAARATEALRTTLRVLRPAVDAAHAAGVVLALENVADRSGDTGPVGARLTEVGDALHDLGIADAGSPIGFTFDVSHALLAYRGDLQAIIHDLRPLLPHIVHLHVNAPRFYPSEEPWADRHEAPTEGFRPLWDLFRLALASPRFQDFRQVTYEVNWAGPWLSPVMGGSRLPAVIRGYDLVQRVVHEEFAKLDAQHAASYSVGRVRSAIEVPAANEPVRHVVRTGAGD